MKRKGGVLGGHSRGSGEKQDPEYPPKDALVAVYASRTGSSIVACVSQRGVVGVIRAVQGEPLRKRGATGQWDGAVMVAKISVRGLSLCQSIQVLRSSS